VLDHLGCLDGLDRQPADLLVGAGQGVLGVAAEALLSVGRRWDLLAGPEVLGGVVDGTAPEARTMAIDSEDVVDLGLYAARVSP